MGTNKKKITIISLLSVLLLAGVVSPAEAVSSNGTATISLHPASGNFTVGQTFPVEIKINTQGIRINGVQIYLGYHYQDATPPLEIQDTDWVTPGIQIQPGNLLLDFILNEVQVDPQAKTVRLGLAALTSSYFLSSTDMTLGTINFRAQLPATRITLAFDPSLSFITENEQGEDILQTPVSGIYTIGNSPTTTPIPILSPVPTAAHTPVPTSSPTSPPPTPTICPTLAIGDLNCDGKINEVDLTLFLKNRLVSPTLTTILEHWQL